MNVFKTAITVLVILTVAFISPSVHAVWHYQMNPIKAPSLTKTRILHNPTVANIQAAIAPNTNIIITGTVRATNSARLNIERNDVRLDFRNASQVRWTGEDTWDGFINISAKRVQVLGLNFRVLGNGGRCRGVTINSPSTDVRIARCTFNYTADGVVADGTWARIVIRDSSFLNCGNWADDNMPGGYGIFMEDDDHARDDLYLINLNITLASSSGQHGIRLSQVERVQIHKCTVTANQKRSLWAYGVDCMAVSHSTFRKGSVLFNLMPHEYYTDRPTTRVRIDRCKIQHTGILQPLSVYCGRGSRHIIVRDLDITSSSSTRWLSIGWRTDEHSEYIRWYNQSVTFNGHSVNGLQHASISDFSSNEQNSLGIGPMADPR